MIPPGLLVLGFGGHARSVADVAVDAGIAQLLFVDGNARPGESLAGFAVVAACPELPDGWRLFPAAGANAQREAQVAALPAGAPVYTLVARDAYVGLGAAIGRATYVAHHAHIGPFASVGEGCIVNTGAIIDHESRVGDYSHVSVNTTIAGRCRVGRRVFVGAGAVIKDNVDVGDDITIGAGGVVVRPLREPGVYVGNPVRRIR